MQTFYGYVRVSTAKQGEHGVSLEQQRDAISRYSYNHGLQIAQWFEEQETAARRGRPVFGQMLRLLRTGKANGVIIHKIDRSARNLKDWADLGELIDSGITVHFANESLDLNSRGGRLSADIQAVVAADYIRNLREETKKGFYGRLKQGLFPRPAPVGYLNQGPGKLKLVDTVQAPLVRQAFELYSSGNYNLRDLTDIMYRKGLRTPHGGKVKHQPLAKVLANEFYTGLVRIRKTNETYEGKHEPIVPLRLFQRVQLVLQGKSRRKTKSNHFLYRQLFLCSADRRYLVGEEHKGHVYYRCHAKRCPSAILREESIDTAVIHKLTQLEFSQDEKNYFRTRLQEMKQSWQDDTPKLMQGVELRLKQVEERQSRLTDAYLDHTIDKESFEQRKTALFKERRDLQDGLSDMKAGTRAVPEQLEEVLELAINAYVLYRSALPDEKRELLKRMSSNRVVDGKEVKITLESPFQVIAERGKGGGGCPSRSTALDGKQLIKKLWKHFEDEAKRKEQLASGVIPKDLAEAS